MISVIRFLNLKRHVIFNPMQTTRGFFVILILFIVSSCASVKLRTADTYYEQLQYANAIPYYEEVMHKKYSDEVSIKLADCYRNTKNFHRSERNAMQKLRAKGFM